MCHLKEKDLSIPDLHTGLHFRLLTHVFSLLCFLWRDGKYGPFCTACCFGLWTPFSNICWEVYKRHLETFYQKHSVTKWYQIIVCLCLRHRETYSEKWLKLVDIPYKICCIFLPFFLLWFYVVCLWATHSGFLITSAVLVFSLTFKALLFICYIIKVSEGISSFDASC